MKNVSKIPETSFWRRPQIEKLLSTVFTVQIWSELAQNAILMYELKILIFFYWSPRISVKTMGHVKTTKKAESTSNSGPFAWVSRNDCNFLQGKKMQPMHATHCNVYLREMHITFPEPFKIEKSAWTWNIWIISQHQILKTTQHKQNWAGFGLLGTLSLCFRTDNASPSKQRSRNSPHERHCL